MTNQRASGRCWLFASTNVFRVALMRRYGLESFELSQAYLFFWDKLEKANYFLENIIDTAASGEDLDGRLVQRLLADPVSDGGQWDMVFNLVDKYGLVPHDLYPDSWSAAASSTLNYVVVAKLRGYAVKLRALVAEVLDKVDGPTTLYADNDGAIKLTKGYQFHARTKHIDIRYHYIREVHDKGIVDVFYIDGNNNPADIFTKNLGAVKFLKFRSQLGLHFRESSAA